MVCGQMSLEEDLWLSFFLKHAKRNPGHSALELTECFGLSTWQWHGFDFPRFIHANEQLYKLPEHFRMHCQVEQPT